MATKTYISSLLLILLLALLSFGSHAFIYEETTIEKIQEAMTNNQVTSRELVDYYQRMQGKDTKLKSFIEWNQDAFSQSDAADIDRNAGHKGTLLRGIPVLIKDNIATKDKMQTTAGSYALVGSVVPRDAFVVQKLRDAKAVIIGKGSLSEWSGFRDSEAPGGWSARGGQGKNPYNAEAPVCGSSSGPAIAVAANLVTVALGSETDGSILCPASANSVVGFKPTVGLTSRAGVIPISPRQDTVGAITRTVADAVHVLDIIAGTDPLDSATSDADKHKPQNGYKQHLISDGLTGKRLGILRTSPFFNLTRGPDDVEYNKTYENHFKTIKDKGAILVDNLVIPNIDTITNFTLSGEKLALLAEFKIALNAYLGELTSSPVKSLLELINFNKNNNNELIDEVGQGLLLEAQSTNGLNSTVNEAISNLTKLTQGFEKVITDNKLDAVLIPGIVEPVYNLFSIGGYPAITVPAGYDPDDWPFGFVFGGLKYTEDKLIEIAYGFEQATLARRAPDVSALLIRKVTDA
ncbi:Amidase family protein [Quillaja saponaria]|uniref:Amidase family protein n=1 Tax=Quillaja saponaria TaxID=32244 RepID=A0AAD7QJ69_QUISA|nr:Amidase family protein [Quillaja saponaria]